MIMMMNVYHIYVSAKFLKKIKGCKEKKWKGDEKDEYDELELCILGKGEGKFVFMSVKQHVMKTFMSVEVRPQEFLK
jgi:hypothetical protein